MAQTRKPFQGVWNIIRFNWHFYVLSFGLLTLSLLLATCLNNPFQLYCYILCLVILIPILISLSVSFYVYDLSGLYSFNWLNEQSINENSKIVTINAGFDETTLLLKDKFSNAEFFTFDFYNPLKHTEPSIKRARKAYPLLPGTQQVTTNSLPLQDNFADAIFIILAAHEIRNKAERIGFFKELKRVLKPSGQIILTEHLRDTPNFLAYNIGFLHFYSKSSWLNTFQAAQLQLKKEIKITPFISTFILQKNGNSF